VIHVVILDREPQVSGILKQILDRTANLGPVQAVANWADLKGVLVQHLRSVAVLGPSMGDADLEQAVAAATQHPGTAFVQVVDHLEVETLRRAMRFGIREVISVGDCEHDLASTVERAHTATAAAPAPAAVPAQHAEGKVVTVFGTKGGTGKTLVATNLAIDAAKSGLTTVLFDANAWFGDCAAFLRLRPQRTIADLAGILGPIDESALGSALAAHESGLRVLAAPADPLDAHKLEGSLIARVIEGLKRSFDLVVVDTGAALDEFTVAALAQSDLSYLVTSLELPAIKDAKLTLAMFKNFDLHSENVRVILNRANSKVGFPPDEVGKALGRRVAIELPSDIAVPRAVNAGLPVAADSPKAKVVKSLGKITADMRSELFASNSQRKASPFLRSARPRIAES
jgi:pilus assembly protein CpaE